MMSAVAPPGGGQALFSAWLRLAVTIVAFDEAFCPDLSLEQDRRTPPAICRFWRAGAVVRAPEAAAVIASRAAISPAFSVAAVSCAAIACARAVATSVAAWRRSVSACSRAAAAVACASRAATLAASLAASAAAARRSSATDNSRIAASSSVKPAASRFGRRRDSSGSGFRGARLGGFGHGEVALRFSGLAQPIRRSQNLRHFLKFRTSRSGGRPCGCHFGAQAVE